MRRGNLPANGWLVPFEISQATGMSEIEVVAKLHILKVAPLNVEENEIRLDKYPAWSVNTLLENPVQILPAAEWGYTVNEICGVVNKKCRWVVKRLGKFKRWGQYRLDKCGRIRFCYPCVVAEKLRRLALACPPAEEWLTAKAISKHPKVQREKWWVMTTLAKVEARPRPRVGKSGRVEDHYSPDDVQKVILEANQFPEAGDWRTVRALAGITGLHQKTVRSRLEEWEVAGEMRWSKNGTATLHFPPSVLAPLLKNPQVQKRGPRVKK